MMKPPTRRRRMSRRAPLVLLAGSLVLLASVGLAAKEKPAGGEEGKPKPAAGQGDSGLYASTFGRSGADHRVVHYWSKGALFRSETIITGHPIVTIVNGDFYYTLDTLVALGVAIRRDPQAIAADGEHSRPFANDLEEIIAAGGEKIRSEVLFGVEVDVYRITDEEGRRTLWVTQDEMRLPVRLESYERKSARTGRLDWVNWMPGIAIPDSFFEPPARIRLERFDSYEDYIARFKDGPVPSVPVLFREFLRGRSK